MSSDAGRPVGVAAEVGLDWGAEALMMTGGETCGGECEARGIERSGCQGCIGDFSGAT